MQGKKIQCILLQSGSGGQGDIPIPVEKKGTLTHYKWDLAGSNCSASAIHCTSVFKDFLRWLLKPDVNIYVQQIHTIYNNLPAGLMNSHWWHLAAAVCKPGW